MFSSSQLEQTLSRIDGRGYKAYKDIKGDYDLEGCTLLIDHVQGDPFAAPTRVRVRVPMSIAGFPELFFDNRSRNVAATSYLARRFGLVARRFSRSRGSGKSGEIDIRSPGQQVIALNAVILDEHGVEARFTVGLPAAGRRVLGREAASMLLDDVPSIARTALRHENLDQADIERHAFACEDADFLRASLASRDLVAFVAKGSILPRRSGVDDRPMDKAGAVAFEVPQGLEASFDLPNSGTVLGMGIPRGVNLIVGGGFHGKSSLLNALEKGVYNHVPGDGRELVVTESGAVKIRAEDGRSVAGVDISPFISDLPGGQSTADFSTPNASGSTSQAANIIEALEAGATTVMIDEDTAATNFMIRDRRMQELVSRDREPITTFLDRSRQLLEERGVSTIIVMGGSGDYFDTADRVIAMDAYVPHEVTTRAREIATRYETGRCAEASGPFGEVTHRSPAPASIDPSRGRRDVDVKAVGLDGIRFGRNLIDVGAVEQIVDPGQTRALGDALNYAKEKYMDGERTISQVLDLVMDDVEKRGLDVLSRRLAGEYVAFRRYELAAVLNRLRSLKVKHR